MTGAQEPYLNTLAREAGETVDPDLTKAEASERIDELQQTSTAHAADSATAGFACASGVPSPA